MLHVFTYGSLMFPPVWSSIVRGIYAAETATLHGYQRVKLRGEFYPALLPGEDPGRSVEGVIYFNLSEADAALLDQFEGADYRREQVEVNLANGDTLKAWVYLWRDLAHPALLNEPWDVDEFKREGLARFLRDYPGFAHSQ